MWRLFLGLGLSVRARSGATVLRFHRLTVGCPMFEF